MGVSGALPGEDPVNSANERRMDSGELGITDIDSRQDEI